MSRNRERSPEQLTARLAELRHDFTDLPEGERSDEDARRIRAMISEVNELDAELTAALAVEAKEAGHLAATQPGGDRPEQRSGTRQLIESDAFREWEQAGFPNRGFSVALNCGIEAFERRDVAYFGEFDAGGPGYTWGLPTPDATGSGYLLPIGQPVPPVPRQARLYLRDLIPKMSTTLSSIPYVRELTPTASELGASAVAEGSAKPVATPSFEGAKADPTVLATTMTMSKQLWSDAPAVVSYVNQRLPYLVKFKEDWEFLNGSGTWPEMQGILNVTGVQSQTATASEVAITIGNAFAKVELADGQPTAVVMNPTNAWSMFLRRAAGGSGTFDAGTPFSALPLTVWGVPTYRTRAKAAGSALVADFQRGAQIVDREQVNVQVYQERYAEQNLVLLIAEERVGIMWFRPDLFVNTAFA